VDALFSYGFIQTIMKPTRVNQNSATLIDHFITSNVNEYNESAILISDLSDHFPIFYFTKSNITAKKPMIKSRDFSLANINRLTEQFQNLNWEYLYTIQNTQEAYNNFSDTFLTYLIYTSLLRR